MKNTINTISEFTRVISYDVFIKYFLDLDILNKIEIDKSKSISYDFDLLDHVEAIMTLEKEYDISISDHLSEILYSTEINKIYISRFRELKIKYLLNG